MNNRRRWGSLSTPTEHRSVLTTETAQIGTFSMALKVHTHELHIVQAREHPTTGANFLQRSEEEFPLTKDIEHRLEENKESHWWTEPSVFIIATSIFNSTLASDVMLDYCALLEAQEKASHAMAKPDPITSAEDLLISITRISTFKSCMTTSLEYPLHFQGFQVWQEK